MVLGKIVLEDEQGWHDVTPIPPSKHQMLGGIAHEVGLSEAESKSDFDKRLKEFAKRSKDILTPKEHGFLKSRIDWVLSHTWGVIKFILEDIWEFLIIPSYEYTADAFFMSPKKWLKKYGHPRQVSMPRARSVGRMRI